MYDLCDMYDLYDLAHVAGIEAAYLVVCNIYDRFPGLDLFYTDLAIPLTTAGEKLL